MSQADEDEARWLMRDDDAFNDDPIPFGAECDEYRRHYGRHPFEEPRRIQVEIPGSVQLDALHPGETFRFANAMSASNVYMVIQSQDLDDSLIHYVLLNSGRLYSSRPTKRVMQVDVRMSIDTRSGRVRV